MPLLNVEKAIKELKETSLDEIERTTALTWGGRAVASYRLSGEAPSMGDRFRRFYEGENFRQEAFEHASMADAEGDVLQGVREEIDAARESALRKLEQVGRQTSYLKPTSGARR